MFYLIFVSLTLYAGS